MSRPLSQLVSVAISEGRGTPRILTLHDFNGHAGDIADYGFAANPHARITGLSSYKGVYLGREVIGYTWFVGPNEQPSPIFFGDALAEIERFLWDEVSRQAGETAELPFLLGVGQGAIMSIAAAAAVPDLISGVIAINGFLPIVSGWQPPLAPLENLPILLVNEAAETPHGERILAGDRLIETLNKWGGDVTRHETPTGEIPCEAMSSWLAAYAPKFRSKESFNSQIP